jgi:hypothetical protein
MTVFNMNQLKLTESVHLIADFWYFYKNFEMVASTNCALDEANTT